MRQVPGHALWLGHLGDARDVRGILSAGIAAVIDLALNESPLPLTRELVYCRFPLIDGPGNPAWLLGTAVDVVARLLRSGTPTLVYCGAGMSRTPAIAAGALSLVLSCRPSEALALVAQCGPADVTPGLWEEVRAALA